jgi:AraC-like DNA-binding protein
MVELGSQINLMQSNAPPGTQERQEILYNLLGTKVLENVAGLCRERIFYGRPRPDRISSRQRFPAVREFYEGQPSAGRHPGHHHCWPEIATVAEGHLDVAIGDHIYRAERGDWFVVKPNIPHGECCDLARSYYRMVWFEMDRPFPNLHATEYRLGNGYESFGIFGLPPLPSYLRASATALFGEEWPPENQARMHLLRWVTWVIELLDQSLNTKPSKASQKVIEAQELIFRADDAYPSVKQLANKVGVSANYLSTLFHAQTGITIRQFIANRRIEKAKSYLADHSCSIKEVAYRLGFHNPYHFSNAFRRATGVRPSAYQLSLVDRSPHADGHYPESAH